MKIPKVLKQLVFIVTLSLLSLFLKPGAVQAGTDLTVTCADEGPCSVSPASTPLFSETNLYPGITKSQTLSITNNDSDDTCDLGVSVSDFSKPSGQIVDLQDVIFAAITDGSTDYFGSETGGVADSTSNYQDLYGISTVSLGSLSPGATRVYTWYATFDSTADNSYQGVSSTFDFDVAVSCTGGTTTTTTSGGGGGGGGGGGSSGSAPVCSANAPSSAPSVSVTGIGLNTVSLSWSQVSPVTHYALIFTRDDGEQYGSTNIGNSSSYTVTNLSGGHSYTFEVFGVNDCAPGPRGSAGTGSVGGPVVAGRPVGSDGQVLGAETEPIEQTPEEEPPEGQVEGAATCAAWKSFLPWILLVLQALVIIIVEYSKRKERTFSKHLLAGLTTVISIVLFYLLRSCPCLDNKAFLAWLCKWYWVVALVIWLALRAFAYGFLEEVESKKPSEKKTD